MCYTRYNLPFQSQIADLPINFHPYSHFPQKLNKISILAIVSFDRIPWMIEIDKTERKKKRKITAL